MNKLRDLLYKTLIVGIVILFCGMSVVSSTGYVLTDNHSSLKNQVKESAYIVDNDTTPPITWHILYPPEPNGENGWYITEVDITICAKDNESGVFCILCSLNGGAEQAYYGSCFSPVLTEDYTSLTIRYSAIDNAGNKAPYKSFTIHKDEYKPIIDVNWDVKIKWLNWFVRFNCEAEDWASGMDRVEMYINEVLQLTVNGSGPVYEFIIKFSSIVTNSTFRFVAYDIAGLSAFTLVNGSDIEKYPCIKSYSYHHSNKVWLQSLIDIFPFLEVLLRIINQ